MTSISEKGIYFEKICESLRNYEETTVYYTLFNLDQAGFISMDVQWASGGVYSCCVNYITYDGHEFLAKIKSDTTWGKTIETEGKVGNFGLQMIAKIAEGVATAYLSKILV